MIWKTPISLDVISARAENTLSTYLGIEFTEIGADFLRATMPVDPRTRQPIGIMHGGASCVLAETLGSVAGNFCVDLNVEYCVGLDINTNHLRQVREGLVTGTARPFHLGKKTQVWSIEIRNDQDELVSINRLTLMVLKK